MAPWPNNDVYCGNTQVIRVPVEAYLLASVQYIEIASLSD